MSWLLPLCLVVSMAAAQPSPQEPQPKVRELKELIREDLKAVRRARYALKRAAAKEDSQAARGPQEQLREAKARLKGHRLKLRQLIGSPRRSPRRQETPSPQDSAQLRDSVADVKPEERPIWLRFRRRIRGDFP